MNTGGKKSPRYDKKLWSANFIPWPWPIYHQSAEGYGSFTQLDTA